MSSRLSLLTILAAGVLLAAAPAAASEQETDEETLVFGEQTLITSGVEGDRSAKLEEYTELPSGVTGTVRLDARNLGTGYYTRLRAHYISENDQSLFLATGRQGKVGVSVAFDRMPHRFANDALTLYNEPGSARLRLPDGMRQDLQGTPSGDRRNRLVDFYLPAASPWDVRLRRDTGELRLDLHAAESLKLRLEVQEQRKRGARPFAGAFGHGHTVELTKPIDYSTLTPTLVLEYGQAPTYLGLTAGASYFRNENEALVWDNPFQLMDGFQGATGRLALPPDNRALTAGMTFTRRDLPGSTSVAVGASWSQWRQNERLLPYTSNTNVIPGGPGSPPFDATDPASLPVSRLDGQVETLLLSVRINARPTSLLSLGASYRYHDYDNQTPTISFPGRVRADEGSWLAGALETIPISRTRATATADVGFHLARQTTLSLGYRFEEVTRRHSEVADSDEGTLSLSVNTRPQRWLSLRAAYETSRRTGDYDYTVPFGGEEVVPQLPFLRKYDQANRDRDQLRFVATAFPTEDLSLSANLITGKDDFRDSPFGLREAKRLSYGLNIDWMMPTVGLELHGFYNREEHRALQQARQWVPNGAGDPFRTEPELESPSNWTARSSDTSDSLGLGLTYEATVRTDVGADFLYTRTDGVIRLASPLGEVDANPFEPLDFTEVDDAKLYSLHAWARMKVGARTALSLGYRWERLDIDDFQLDGFELVPGRPDGTYNGAILWGTLPVGYDVNVFYAQVSVGF